MKKVPKIERLNQAVNFHGKTWIITTVCKKDLTENLSKKEIAKLSDYDMEEIARKMADYLQEYYWDCLEASIDYFKERNK